jgi:molybdate transport system substrate-binding protein
MNKITSRKLLAGILSALLVVVALTGCGTGSKPPAESTEPAAPAQSDASPAGQPGADANYSGEILVSAAASLKESMAELEAIFNSKYPNVTLTFNFGASGSLQQQIEQGAPADVFLSAGKKQMTALVDGGLIAPGTNRDILQNEVVLIAPKDNTTVASFDDLVPDKVTHLALGETASVPVGQYSKQILEKLQLFEPLAASDKIVYAKDVKEVLTWVSGGNADVGMVYLTDAKTVPDAVKVVATAPADAYSPAVYPIGIIKASQNQELAQLFVDLVTSSEGKAIFEKYGFKALF